MPRLPRVLSSRDLPLAELQAAQLDGELCRVGELWCAIDEPDGFVVRATSLGLSWPKRYIAERRSAAWVWGALDMPPLAHDLCASLGARTRPQPGARVNMREVSIDSTEIVEIGGLLVTTPLRTMTDLARFAGMADGEALWLMRRLSVDFALAYKQCRSAIDAPRNLPNVRLARRRIDATFDLDPQAVPSARCRDRYPELTR